MKKNKIFKYIILGLAIAINIFIIVNGFIDQDASAKESGAIEQVAEAVVNAIQRDTVTDATRTTFSSFIRKFIGHFCLFGLSGIFTTLSFGLFLEETRLKSGLFVSIFSMFFGSVIAMLSELAQLIAKDRVFSFKDIAIDCVGFLLGLLFILLINFIVKLSIQNNEKKQA